MGRMLDAGLRRDPWRFIPWTPVAVAATTSSMKNLKRSAYPPGLEILQIRVPFTRRFRAKSRRERFVPLDPDLKRWLQSLGRDIGPVFTTRRRYRGPGHTRRVRRLGRAGPPQHHHDGDLQPPAPRLLGDREGRDGEGVGGGKVSRKCPAGVINGEGKSGRKP